MGQKINPISMRLGINKDWKSRYYPSDGNWASLVVMDKKIRNYFDSKIKQWAISSIEIERTEKKLKIIINTVRPGTILGIQGENIKKVELDIKKLIKTRDLDIKINVIEIQNPDLDATIIANEIAVALENRASFRIAQKRVIRRVMKAGAKGIKTQVSGRLNGVDMARTEGYSHGEVPLQTIRNDIDYAKADAHTTYGVLGVKVWISRGEIFSNFQNDSVKPKFTKNKKEFVKKEFVKKEQTQELKEETDNVKPKEN